MLEIKEIDRRVPVRENNTYEVYREDKDSKKRSFISEAAAVKYATELKLRSDSKAPVVIAMISRKHYELYRG